MFRVCSELFSSTFPVLSTLPTIGRGFQPTECPPASQQNTSMCIAGLISVVSSVLGRVSDILQPTGAFFVVALPLIPTQHLCCTMGRFLEYERTEFPASDR
jgi:hypothetical protein